MTVFIDTPRYYVETTDPYRSAMRVVRKADGAFYELCVDEEGPGFLWLHADGCKDLSTGAEEWIGETVKRATGCPARAMNEFWTFPEGTLEAWAKEFGYGPDMRPEFTMSHTAWAERYPRWEAEARARERERAREEAKHKKEIAAAEARKEREKAKRDAKEAANARRAAVRQSRVDRALAREFGEPIPAAA